MTVVDGLVPVASRDQQIQDQHQVMPQYCPYHSGIILYGPRCSELLNPNPQNDYSLQRWLKERSVIMVESEFMKSLDINTHS